MSDFIPPHVPGGFMCRRNIHLWLTQDDAAKCCDPEWRRIIVINEGTHQQMCAGVMLGRKWVKTSELESSRTLEPTALKE